MFLCLKVDEGELAVEQRILKATNAIRSMCRRGISNKKNIKREGDRIRSQLPRKLKLKGYSRSFLLKYPAVSSDPVVFQEAVAAEEGRAG